MRMKPHIWLHNGKWRCGYSSQAPHAIGWTVMGAWRAWLRYFYASNV